MFATLQRYGLTEAARRLHQVILVTGPDDCWEYTGAPITNGYGRLKFGRHERFLAHRVAWALANRAEPGDMLVCHRCDNRVCCNPAHLFLGTPLDNTRDMAAKGRRAKQSEPRKRVRGTKLTIEDARSIREANRPSRELAIDYAVSLKTIQSIKSGRIWSEAGRARRRVAKADHVPTIQNPTFHSTQHNRGGQHNHE